MMDVRMNPVVNCFQFCIFDILITTESAQHTKTQSITTGYQKLKNPAQLLDFLFAFFKKSVQNNS